MKLKKLLGLNKSDEELTGLGGWLVLLGLGLVGSLTKNAYELLGTYVPLFLSGRWAAMTAPEGETYNPDLAAFAVFEAGALTALLALNAYTLFQFFTRKRAFAKTLILLLVVSLAFSIADIVAFAALLPGRVVFDDATAATLVGGVVSLLVWGVYVRRSRRVKLTFTRS